MRCCVLLAAFALLLAAGPATAQTLQPAGLLGGIRLTDAWIHDGHVYVTDGGGLTVVDTATGLPVARFAGPYEALVPLDGEIWVGDATRTDLYDVTNAAAPVFVATLPTPVPGLGAYDPATQHYFGLVELSSSYRLDAYDASSPASPSLVSQTAAAILKDSASGDNWAHTTFKEAVLVQGLLYLGYEDLRGDRFVGTTGGNQNIRIWNVTDPTLPFLVRDMQITPWSPLGFHAEFAVDGSLLYVHWSWPADGPGDSVLSVYDVDPDSGPSFVASLPEDVEFGTHLRPAYGMVLDPVTSHLRVWGDPYHEIDVSTPSAPALVCETVPSPQPIVAKDEAQFLIETNTPPHSYDLYDPTCGGLNLVSSFPHGYGNLEVAVLGDHLFLAGFFPALADVSNPATAHIVTPVDGNGPAVGWNASTVKAIGPTAAAYVIQSSDVLWVLDASDPQNPTWESFSGSNNAYRLAASWGTTYAFLQDGPQTETSIQLVDGSTPTNIHFKGNYGRESTEWSPGNTEDLLLYEDAAYVSVLDEVWVIDFSNVNNPQLETTLVASTLGAASEVQLALAGDLLITSDIDDHRLWSLADPLNPTPVATLPLGPSASRIEDAVTAGGYSFFWYDGELLGFDLSTPASPQQVSALTPGWMHHPNFLDVVNDHVVAYYDEQLWILEIVEGTALSPVPRRNSDLVVFNTPNPFNPRTTIVVEAPQRLVDATVAIYDLAGRRVDVVFAGELAPGTRSIEWDGTDAAGRRVGSGTYFVRVVAPGWDVTRKITLLK